MTTCIECGSDDGHPLTCSKADPIKREIYVLRKWGSRAKVKAFSRSVTISEYAAMLAKDATNWKAAYRSRRINNSNLKKLIRSLK